MNILPLIYKQKLTSVDDHDLTTNSQPPITRRYAVNKCVKQNRMSRTAIANVGIEPDDLRPIKMTLQSIKLCSSRLYILSMYLYEIVTPKHRTVWILKPKFLDQ